MIKVIFFLLFFISALLFPKAQQIGCDSLLQAIEGTYQLKKIVSSSERRDGFSRPLTCEELDLIVKSRKNIQVVLKLDNFTEAIIEPNPTYIEK